jgi:hypothetical protein
VSTGRVAALVAAGRAGRVEAAGLSGAIFAADSQDGRVLWFRAP